MSLFREARFIPESLLKSKDTTDKTDKYSTIPAPCPTVFVKLKLPVQHQRTDPPQPVSFTLWACILGIGKQRVHSYHYRGDTKENRFLFLN